MIVPSANRLAYLPRTPPEKSYSGSISSASRLGRTFLILSPLAGRCDSRADNSDRIDVPSSTPRSYPNIQRAGHTRFICGFAPLRPGGSLSNSPFMRRCLPWVPPTANDLRPLRSRQVIESKVREYGGGNAKPSFKVSDVSCHAANG